MSDLFHPRISLTLFQCVAVAAGQFTKNLAVCRIKKIVNRCLVISSLHKTSTPINLRIRIRSKRSTYQVLKQRVAGLRPQMVVVHCVFHERWNIIGTKRPNKKKG